MPNSIVCDSCETTSSKFNISLEICITSYKKNTRQSNLFLKKYFHISGTTINCKKVLVCLEEDLVVRNVFLNRRLLKNLLWKQIEALECLADRAVWNILKILKLVIYTYTHIFRVITIWPLHFRRWLTLVWMVPDPSSCNWNYRKENKVKYRKSNEIKKMYYYKIGFTSITFNNNNLI